MGLSRRLWAVDRHYRSQAPGIAAGSTKGAPAWAQAVEQRCQPWAVDRRCRSQAAEARSGHRTQRRPAAGAAAGPGRRTPA
eukprot:159672-Alexandrium_andersonii.AAC.1